MKDYQFESHERTKLVGEMLSAAASSGPQTRAIMLLTQWYEDGEQGEEPDLSGLISWKMECAISTDLTHIYRAKRPAGVFGSEYSREFIGLKRENARRAALRQRRSQGGLEGLKSLLAL
jgi:hypothetical protein